MLQVFTSSLRLSFCFVYGVFLNTSFKFNVIRFINHFVMACAFGLPSVTSSPTHSLKDVLPHSPPEVLVLLYTLRF